MSLLKKEAMKRSWSIEAFLINKMALMLLLSLSGCVPRFDHTSVRKLHIEHKNINTHVQTDTIFNTKSEGQRAITIWIHGTRLFSRPVFAELFNNKTSLKPIRAIPEKHILRTIAESVMKKAPDHFNADDFYVFGWSGKLSFTARYEASKTLYDKLKELAHNYHLTYGHKPYIRIITHSHGGNVALNLAYTQGIDEELSIDELILLACPVQAQTKHLIYDPIFKQIFSLYSCLDFIQIIDPQGLYSNHTKSTSFFSERCFPSCEKLFQVKIRMNKRAITHNEFIHTAFLEQLPLVLDEIAQWHKQEPILITQKASTKRLLSLETGVLKKQSTTT